MTLIFSLLALSLLIGGFGALEAQKYYVRWKDDRTLEKLCGGCWALSLVCLGLAIASFVGAF